MRPLAALGLALLLGACAPEPNEVRLVLLPAQAIGCQPTEVRSLALQALGDSPAEARPPLRVQLDRVSTIDSFPPTTAQVAVEAEGIIERVGGGQEPWAGGGIAILSGGVTELRLPLLRFGRACALSDSAAGVPAGATVAALGDGRLVVVGGDRGLEDLRIVVVDAAEALARTVDLPGVRPRIDAALTSLGGSRVVVTGGLGRESFEVIDVDTEELLDDGLIEPRRAHGAARLPDGRVLLVGGRSLDDSARRDAELLTIDDDGRGESRATEGELAAARISPTVLALDDGTVLVLGGTDEAGEPVSTIERFDRGTESFTSLGAPWPARTDARYVALAGGRAARVGGLDAGTWSRSIAVLLDRGETYVSLGAALTQVFERPRAVALGDGRVLVLGAVACTPAAQVVNPGESREATPIDVGRAPTHVARLVEGTLALLDGDGVSLLRVDLSGPFTDPAASILPAQLDGRDELALDAPGRWRGEGEYLRAGVDGARLDLPSSRFAAVRVELEFDGALEVLLTVEGEAPQVIAVDGAASHGDCRVDVDGTLVVERDGTSLRLVGTNEGSCSFPSSARVGVAVRARVGAGVRRLSVARR